MPDRRVVWTQEEGPAGDSNKPDRKSRMIRSLSDRDDR
jgi:hypothetical protein